MFVFFFSLFIEGFHLDPLPEPLGSYMSGKNYCLSNKKESFLLMPCIFIALDDKMFFKITSVYTTAKTKDKTKYKKTTTNKQTKENLEVRGQDDLKSPCNQSLLLSTELKCRKGGSALITSNL